jgi:hypothetical protein
MKCCPVCGANLAQADKVRRMLKVRTAQRWQDRNRDRYNAYQRDYQRKYRARKRAAIQSQSTNGTAQ